MVDGQCRSWEAHERSSGVLRSVVQDLRLLGPEVDCGEGSHGDHGSLADVCDGRHFDSLVVLTRKR